MSRIHVLNFRNFSELDLKLGGNTLIVGENKVGKSNLLHALRLVLDPSLPDEVRHLRLDDFWDGLPRPFSKDDRVRISVDFTAFEDDDLIVALLADYLVDGSPMVARLTYEFRPLETLERPPKSEADYEYVLYGGSSSDTFIRHDIRRRLPLEYLSALRDAETDLAISRRSPLIPLLRRATKALATDDLAGAVRQLSEITQSLLRIPELEQLSERITRLLQDLVGPRYGEDFELGLAPTDTAQIIRSLRLLSNHGQRTLADASLGIANLLYLSLRTLNLQEMHEEGSRSHTVWAIEEPEAHLHPHLQRLVYRHFLQVRGYREVGGAGSGPSSTTILMTSHSPHLVSICPIKSIVLLRQGNDGEGTRGVSTANLPVTTREQQDLERYIDVTRGEILFSRAVLLVEGESELFLVPALARTLGYQLDEYGISVCSVMGTNFLPYLTLVGPHGLDIPFAILTDLDLQPNKVALAEQRTRQLIESLTGTEPKFPLQDASTHGIFVNDGTLEVSSLRSGLGDEMCVALAELSLGAASKTRAERWRADPAAIDEARFLEDISTIGKGRYAQRLASLLTRPVAPQYIREAIEYLVARCP